MNLLIFSRPGIRIYQELRRSETAWHALRFYNPVEIPVGITIPLSSLSAAITLASDLKYFIRKYASGHIFETAPGSYCTAGVARARYLTRDDAPDPWPWKLWYLVSVDNDLIRQVTPPGERSSEEMDPVQGLHIFQVYCTEEEHSALQYL